MAHHQIHRGPAFDPTLSLATDRMQARHHEAHSERLAALSVMSGTPIRVRVGQALIGLGHALVTPAGAQQPSLTD
jgi:hypothetical protein